MGLTIFLSLLVVGLNWGSSVIKTDMSAPTDVVQTRKALMMAIKVNMDDVAQKIKANQIKGISANAMAIDVMARVIPPLYREKHADAYNGKGNYYKGAPAAEIEAIALKLSRAAQVLLSGAKADDKKAVQGGVGKVYQTCGLCHKKYRAKF